MDQDRLIELETRMTYQEQTLQVLNEVVTRQQDQIDRLQAAIRQLAQRMIDGEPGSKNTPAEEVPPHY